MKQKGFALLTIVIVTSVIMIFSLGWWKRSSMIHELVIDRETYVKRFYVTDLLLNYGIHIVKHNWYAFVTKKKTSFDIAFILRQLEYDNYNADCMVEKKTTFFRIKTTLYKYDKMVFCIQCDLNKDGFKKNTFFITHYTISTDV